MPGHLMFELCPLGQGTLMSRATGRTDAKKRSQTVSATGLSFASELQHPSVTKRHARRRKMSGNRKEDTSRGHEEVRVHARLRKRLAGVESEPRLRQPRRYSETKPNPVGSPKTQDKREQGRRRCPHAVPGGPAPDTGNDMRPSTGTADNGSSLFAPWYLVSPAVSAEQLSPSHQPNETGSSLRTVGNLEVWKGKSQLRLLDNGYRVEKKREKLDAQSDKLQKIGLGGKEAVEQCWPDLTPTKVPKSNVYSTRNKQSSFQYFPPSMLIQDIIVISRRVTNHSRLSAYSLEPAHQSSFFIVGVLYPTPPTGSSVDAGPTSTNFDAYFMFCLPFCRIADQDDTDWEMLGFYLQALHRHSHDNLTLQSINPTWQPTTYVQAFVCIEQTSLGLPAAISAPYRQPGSIHPCSEQKSSLSVPLFLSWPNLGDPMSPSKNLRLPPQFK
ncbi:uncharacterized protein CLUP02_00648 [Colletotrichum lupini]|uniref:Uncharacterized protein n=1 Tax=Colletotrichum lupini TaxID=145971 RepID=A0A9Q8W8J3_9PEZI|nr:uncharacterized protein CLUP02_00648 [Colletotrichum lupini]UQC74001.1 hypothetical protein CLUP02_00648 [Colletotrichum lupini]